MRAANYVEETTTSIAGTSGDGAITLTSITNIPRFSTVFGMQATNLRYLIEDTINKKFETGIGSVASNVLTRTKPTATWDGANYIITSVTALQFGSTPTSGNIKIRMAATSEYQAPVMDAINQTIGAHPWRDYLLNANYNHGTAGVGTTLTANREYYQAYKLETSGRLSGMQFEVTTLIAASTMSVALYALDSTGLPGNKIVDFNSTSTSTTGIKTDTATGTWSPSGIINLTPGWYAIGYIASHAIAIRAQNATGWTPKTPYGMQSSYGCADVVYAAGSGATLPAIPSPTSILNPDAAGSRCWIGLKVLP